VNYNAVADDAGLSSFV